MFFVRTQVLLALFFISQLAAAFAQTLPAMPSAKPAQAATTPADPYGRGTPSGTVFGFLKAARQHNYKTAGQYLQMKGLSRRLDREDMAAKLALVMDRGFVGSLATVSTEPAGAPQAGLPPDQQMIGKLVAGDVEAELILVRVLEPPSGKIWLLSAESVGHVEEIYDALQATRLEQRLPAFLVETSFYGMALWQWLGIVLSIPAAAFAAWLLLRFVLRPPKWWSRPAGQPATRPREPISRPLWLVLSAVLNLVVIWYLRLPLLQRHYYMRVLSVILIIGLAWLFQRGIASVMRRLYEHAIAHGKAERGSLILLAQAASKGVVFIIAALAVLKVAGFDLTTALAGLGIGGLALAFAAQKTLENLFGGVSLLSDSQMHVGDVYSIGGRVGTVEDISLRSTRLRTVERSELSIPNGSLATMNLENLSQRDKILLTSKLGLAYRTSPEQLRYVLDEFRRLLSQHPKVDSSTARVHLSEFGETALNLEVFCYIFTTDLVEFMATREEILVRMMEIVAEAGTSLALPASKIWIQSEPGAGDGRIKVVEKAPQANVERASAG